MKPRATLGKQGCKKVFINLNVLGVTFRQKNEIDMAANNENKWGICIHLIYYPYLTYFHGEDDTSREKRITFCLDWLYIFSSLY